MPQNWGLGCLALCQAFLRAHQPGVHPLFDPAQTPMGGLSLFQPDWMHCKCLGTDSNLAGSVLAFLCTEVLRGPPEHNIALIWERVQVYYRQHNTKCRLSNLTWTMVLHKPFFKLSAKAIETRDLLPALEAILSHWAENPIVQWFQRLVFLSRACFWQ